MRAFDTLMTTYFCHLISLRVLCHTKVTNGCKSLAYEILIMRRS
jgi:hypothetical protein